MNIVSVYAIFGDAAEAEHIGRTLVEERLAACVNVLGPCRSIYRWQGQIETAEEVPAILKTDSRSADRLVDRIVELHSYDTPCVVAWPIDKVSEGYADWVEGSVTRDV